MKNFSFRRMNRFGENDQQVIWLPILPKFVSSVEAFIVKPVGGPKTVLKMKGSLAL